MKLRTVVSGLIALNLVTIALVQDAAARKRYIREEAANEIGGNLPPGYKISADGPKATFYVLHELGASSPRAAWFLFAPAPPQVKPNAIV
jgi:hypothetical protein